MKFRDWAFLWLWVMAGMSPLMMFAMIVGAREGGLSLVVSLAFTVLGFAMAIRATLPGLDGFEELGDLKLFGLGPRPRRKI